MRNLSSKFLAPGARLGTWWVPTDDDYNEEGDFDELPQRREPGVLVLCTEGGWELLLARQLPAEGASRFKLQEPARGERDLMWGSVPTSSISLFDAIQTSRSTDFPGSYEHSTWRGGWYVDSPTAWVDTSSKIRRVDIEFAAGGGWSERPPGEGLDLDLQRQWDEERTTFGWPEPIVHQAVVGDATVQLRRELTGTILDNALDLRLSTVFSVEDRVELGDVRDKWIKPLHAFVSFFWLRNPGVVRIGIQLAANESRAEVYYAGRLARVERYKPHSAERWAQFATLQGILAHGYSFEDLICGYWQWWERGYGRALELLNESQDSQLDRSLDAQLLNAVKSLESYIKTKTGKSDTVNLGKALNQLLESTDRIGGDIRDIWQARGRQHFANSIVQLRKTYIAHEQLDTPATSRSQDDFLDQELHLVALLWLLRRTYLQAMGIAGAAASDLVDDHRNSPELIIEIPHPGCVW